ncbi:hypothetical protein VM1G_11842 [Cytospora mali]|uniref:Uncharacterized protein n=1 Tax=Cytospora mali TaxID=578113 RepID=A0A194WA76_CYTMA|nr:hypothetical protein VM1G_11842 [Valsa mali]
MALQSTPSTSSSQMERPHIAFPSPWPPCSRCNLNTNCTPVKPEGVPCYQQYFLPDVFGLQPIPDFPLRVYFGVASPSHSCRARPLLGIAMADRPTVEPTTEVTILWYDNSKQGPCLIRLPGGDQLFSRLKYLELLEPLEG